MTTLAASLPGHETVNHSLTNTCGAAYTNTAESRFSLMKRAVFGTHHSIQRGALAALSDGMGFQMEHPQDEGRGTCGRCP